MGIVTTVLEIGEMRKQFALDFQEDLQKIIDKYQRDDPYYLLVYADILDNQIITKIIRLKAEPPKMIGTMLYHINNKKGKVERLWCLPIDIPRSDEVISLKEGLEEVTKSAKDVPIVY